MLFALALQIISVYRFMKS